MARKQQKKAKNGEPPKTGRPTKLTPEVQDAILRALRAGNYMETAAAFGGVHKDTLYDWLKRGRADIVKGKEDGLYASFVRALDKAVADGEVRDVAIIAEAAQGRPAQLDRDGNVIRAAVPPQWTASAWRLERRWPKKWGRFDRVGVEGSEGAEPVHIVVSLAAGHQLRESAEKEQPDG